VHQRALFQAREQVGQEAIVPARVVVELQVILRVKEIM
jgi:hypothetical protein